MKMGTELVPTVSTSLHPFEHKRIEVGIHSENGVDLLVYPLLGHNFSRDRIRLHLGGHSCSC